MPEEAKTLAEAKALDLNAEIARLRTELDRLAAGGNVEEQALGYKAALGEFQASVDKINGTPPATAQAAAPVSPASGLKIDFGCGPNKKEGFIGVDAIKFPGVDVQLDIGKDPWPWQASTVDEAHASHFIEHLDAKERIHFVNELWRVLKPEAKATIVTPHWASTRAYGDLTHKWPPVAEFWYYYLSKEWRKANAPHNTEYTCDFAATWGYSVHPALVPKNQETQSWMLQFYKEACQDMMATLVAKKA